MPMAILGNGRDAPMSGSGIVDIPGVEGRIGRHMRWEGLQRDRSLLMKRTEEGDIGFIARAECTQPARHRHSRQW